MLALYCELAAPRGFTRDFSIFLSNKIQVKKRKNTLQYGFLYVNLKPKLSNLPILKL